MIAWNYFIQSRLSHVEDESKTFHTKIYKHKGDKRDGRKKYGTEGWQPIKTAPKNRSGILAWDGNNLQVTFWMNAEKIPDEYQWFAENYEFHPTHWMPLPQPPEETP